MRRKIEDDEKGVAGFFFDLPVLVLIIAVVLVFITSLHQLYLPMEESNKDLEQNRICLQVKDKIQNYPKILKYGENGEFSIEKLNSIKNETIDSYLEVGQDHAYRLDFENLENGKRWVFGKKTSETSSDIERDSYTIPVSLVDNNDRSYIGKLEVNVWEV